MRYNAADSEMFRVVLTHSLVNPYVGTVLHGPSKIIAGPYGSKGTARGVATQRVNQWIRTNEQWEQNGDNRRYEFHVSIEKAVLDWKAV